MTAAHCQHLHDDSLAIREVVLNEHDVRTDPDCGVCARAQRFEIARGDVRVHPMWDPERQSAGADIALIRLPRYLIKLIYTL